MTVDSHEIDHRGPDRPHHLRHSPSRDRLGDDDFISGLNSVEVGEDLTRGDYLLLGVLGVLLPIALLIWGW